MWRMEDWLFITDWNFLISILLTRLEWHYFIDYFNIAKTMSGLLFYEYKTL